MYQNKMGQFDLPPQRQITRRRPVPASMPVASVQSMQGKSGRLCDGTLPGENNRNSNPTPHGGSMGWGLENHPLAMAYSPYQHFREIYEPNKALSRGTMFAELDLPFEGYKGGRGC